MMTVEIYTNGQEVSRKEIKAIGQLVINKGFGLRSLSRSFNGIEVGFEGAYYGKVIDAINELGYETDADNYGFDVE